jgi:hypothetical protein
LPFYHVPSLGQSGEGEAPAEPYAVMLDGVADRDILLDLKAAFIFFVRLRVLVSSWRKFD